MSIIIDFIIPFIGAFFIFDLVSQILTNKDRFIYKLIRFLLYITIIGNKNWIGDNNPIIILPFILIIFLISFENIWYEKLITAIIMYSLFLPFNMILDTLYYDFHFYGEFFLSIISNIIKITIIFISNYIFKKLLDNNHLKLSKKLWYILGGLISAPFIMVITSTSLGFNNFENGFYNIEAISKALFILPFAFFSAFSILMAMAILSKHEYLVEQENLSKLRDIYFEGLKNEQEQIHIIRHDLRNHFQTLEIMLEQNRIADAKSYLDNLSNKDIINKTQVFSNNDIVNIILSSKLRYIEKYNIKFDYKINLNNNLSISDIELSSLLSNALDNAIEASTNLIDSYIDIILKSEKGLFVFKISNSYNHKLIYSNNKIQTTKTDKKSHGHGIASIKDIVEKYNGFMEIKTTNNIFELLITIPIK